MSSIAAVSAIAIEMKEKPFVEERIQAAEQFEWYQVTRLFKSQLQWNEGW